MRLLPVALFLSGILLFAGAAGAKEPFRVVLISDTHLGFAKTDKAFRAFLKDIPSLPFRVRYLINNGDIAEMGSPKIFEAYNHEIQSLGLVPFNVIGNHDTRWSPDGKDLFVHWIGPRYFSKDFEGIHWMFLDSTLEHQTQGHIGFSEMKWIQEDLRGAPPDEPIFVFSHHPLKWHGTSVDNGLDTLNLFQKHPPAALFNGHGHKLERTGFRGIPLIENDALFHAHYLILEKTGNRVELYVKTVGTPELTPWLRIDLRPSRSAVRIMAPRDGRFVSGNIVVRTRSSPALAPALQVDRSAPLPLTREDQAVPVHLSGSGWHDIRLLTAGNSWGEDETRVFVPDQIRTVSLGEIYAGLATDGRSVFAATLGGNLYAISPQGEVRWKLKLDAPVLASPVADENSLYVGTRKGTLYSIRPAGGTVFWKTQTEAPFTGAPEESGGAVFAGCGDELCAFDAPTGRLRWRAPIGAFTEMQPLVDGGLVFVGSWNRAFYAFDAQSGRLVWGKPIGKAEYYSPSEARPVALSGTVYVAAKDHRVYALDEKTGEEKWSVPTADTFASPVLFENTLVLAGTDGRLTALDPQTGKTLWTKKFDTSFYDASPVVFGRRLLLTGVDGSYVDWNVPDRKIEDSFRLSEGWNFSTPVVLDGTLWAGSLDGRLYGISLKIGKFKAKAKSSKAPKERDSLRRFFHVRGNAGVRKTNPG